MSGAAMVYAGEQLGWRTDTRREVWAEDTIEWARRMLAKSLWWRLKGAPEPTSQQMRALGLVPDDVLYANGNIGLDEGVNQLWLLFSGTGGTAYSNVNAQLGVGDSTAAELAAQTDLQATTNKLFKAMNATFPQVSGRTITFASDFQTGDAIFAWQEWSIRNGTTEPGAMNINRKVQSLGTKPNTQIWTLSVTLSL